ncbi:hypothetical protein AQJ91_19945 [Streptomyces dysideae]|uniref:Uncharacterized protein n=2 Tax=Streptomyces dysideae TaxID=909626 RepID=A0A101UYJ0_9ACTN|nr:hypothetical protein AQJ91_19945 [Streptomyces dysideae]
MVRSFQRRGPAFVPRTKEGVERFFATNGLHPVDPRVIPVHRWCPDRAGPVPQVPDPEYLASLDLIDRIKYHCINDATDSDVSVYAAIAPKPRSARADT